MNYKIHCCLLGLLLQTAAFSQDKFMFHSINTVGLSEGSSGMYGIFQSVNGAGYKKWFGGIGIGADYYHYTSYPLFVDVRYADQLNKAFAYLDLGYHFMGNNHPDSDLYYGSFSVSGGFYDDAGIGYRLNSNHKTTFIFTAGYSYKKVKLHLNSSRCDPGACTINYSDYIYGYGKVVLKAGVDF